MCILFCVCLQDWQAASQPGHTSRRHGLTLHHGMGASRFRLPQGGFSGSPPFTHSICQLRAATHEELDDGQCAVTPPRQVQRLGQRQDVLMVGVCGCWRVRYLSLVPGTPQSAMSGFVTIPRPVPSL